MNSDFCSVKNMRKRKTPSHFYARELPYLLFHYNNKFTGFDLTVMNTQSLNNSKICSSMVFLLLAGEGINIQLPTVPTRGVAGLAVKLVMERRRSDMEDVGSRDQRARELLKV